MAGVRVHYNSARPAQLNAHAYAQGSDIHLAPGQDRHLPHEAWHVVQQAQGRVAPNRRSQGGVLVNDDGALEREADQQGQRAARQAVLGPYGKVGQAMQQTGWAGPGSKGTAQLATKIKVGYNPDAYDRMQGGLNIKLEDLAKKGPDYWETFPADFYGRLAKTLDQTLYEVEEQGFVDTIRKNIATYGVPWERAAPGKRLEAGFDSYEKIQAKVADVIRDKEGYQALIDTNLDTNFRTHKARDFVKPYLAMSSDRLSLDESLHAKLRSLLAWYLPLQAGQIKAVDHKEALIQGMKLVIADYLLEFDQYSSELIEKTTNARMRAQQDQQSQSDSDDEDEPVDVEPPKNARIRKGGPRVIHGYPVGERSEIQTGLIGALRSGEKASPRELESRLTETLRVSYVAGHMVADSLGGKNASYNLTPITNTFNTSGGMNGIKDPEVEGLKRLKAGRVIRYSTHVSYSSHGDLSWFTAVRPTRIDIDIINLKLRGDHLKSSAIENYTDDTEGGDARTYVLRP